MALKILAGDFAGQYGFGGQPSFIFDHFRLTDKTKAGYKKEKISVAEIEEIALASEETVKSMGGAVGWGIAGAALFGPVGALAGALLGGKKSKVAFVCRFKDGRKLMAETDSKTWTSIQAAQFNLPPERPKIPIRQPIGPRGKLP